MAAPNPQTPNARVSFGDILQAIETQLVSDNVVNSDAQICWGTPRNVPQFSGPFDILLVPRNGTHEGRDAGSGQLQMLRLVDIFYRSEAIADPGGGYKSWIIEVFEAGDAIIDSVGDDNYWPEDANGNLLTIESIKLIGDVAPDYIQAGSVFGDYVGTLSCLYFPAIDPTKGPFPMP